MKGLKYA
jgi:hypothetical protein